MNDKQLKNFTVSRSEDGIVQISLDVPRRPLNILNHEVMQELEQIIEDLENDHESRVVVFRSEKKVGSLRVLMWESFRESNRKNKRCVCFRQGRSCFSESNGSNKQRLLCCTVPVSAVDWNSPSPVITASLETIPVPRSVCPKSSWG